MLESVIGPSHFGTLRLEPRPRVVAKAGAREPTGVGRHGRGALETQRPTLLIQKQLPP